MADLFSSTPDRESPNDASSILFGSPDKSRMPQAAIDEKTHRGKFLRLVHDEAPCLLEGPYDAVGPSRDGTRYAPLAFPMK